jgi:hypothetical protein
MLDRRLPDSMARSSISCEARFGVPIPFLIKVEIDHAVDLPWIHADCPGDTTGRNRPS